MPLMMTSNAECVNVSLTHDGVAVSAVEVVLSTGNSGPGS